MEEPYLPQIIGQAASYARDAMWPETQVCLQVAQLILLGALANDPGVEEAVVEHWTDWTEHLFKGGKAKP